MAGLSRPARGFTALKKTISGRVVLPDDVDYDSRWRSAAEGTVWPVTAQSTTAHGMAVPVGVISATGVTGLTLGGGFGWLTRHLGLTVDHLLGADLVTADGREIHTDRNENPELLWALTGGGGNFGVVTSLTLAAHPMPSTVLCANLIYSRPRWSAALRAFAQFAEEVPDEMTSIITGICPPPAWEMGSEPLIVIGSAWSGPDHASGQRYLDDLITQAPPDAQEVGPVEWTAWQSALDPFFPPGVRAYWKNTGFSTFDEEVIDILCTRAAEQTWNGTAFDIHHMGGAFARVPEEDTAFPDRSSRFWLNCYGFWNSAADDVRNATFIRGLVEDLAGDATGAQYINFHGEPTDRSRDSVGEPDVGSTVPAPMSAEAWRRGVSVYGETKLRRLAAVKYAYDPRNVFHLNHTIPPVPAF